MMRYYFDNMYRFSHATEANPNSLPASNATDSVVPEKRPGFEILYDANSKEWYYKEIDPYSMRQEKLAEFDAIFQKLDALKIRPAASIAEALSKGQTPDPGDVYVLSETQAVTEENRRRRDLVEAADTVEAEIFAELDAAESVEALAGLEWGNSWPRNKEGASL